MQAEYSFTISGTRLAREGPLVIRKSSRTSLNFLRTRAVNTCAAADGVTTIVSICHRIYRYLSVVEIIDMDGERRLRFCPACGGNLESREVDDKIRRVCATCGRVHYEQLIVGAGGLIESENKLLLIRRNREPFRDSWCLPAGHVEIDESPEAAALREISEETGLQVGVRELVDAYFFDDHPAGNGVFLVYKCDIVAGIARETHEASTPKFFARDQIPLTLAGGGHRTAIEAWAISTPETCDSGGASPNLSLQNHLSVVWNARYQQDQVLWRIFAAFWPTNAILLAALFRSSGQILPPHIGAITAGAGIFVAILWFFIQGRALWHVERIESTAERLERDLFDATVRVYALSPSLNVHAPCKIRGPRARVVMPVCTVIVGILWSIGLGYFILQWR
jgi:ADP-ribose pyrophosphatase YjhB (NUDIX family)